MSEEKPATKFESTLTFEELRSKIQAFVDERDWEQVILSRLE